MNTVNFVSLPAQMFPDQEILVFGERRFTYGQLWENVRRLGNALRALGVQRGDKVGALQTNSDQYVTAYYATAAIGAVFVPLNYRAKPPELEYMIDTADIAVLLVGAAISRGRRPATAAARAALRLAPRRSGRDGARRG
jgi:fatty-acyl-CoA synthase